MKIDKIILKNYRQFKDAEISFKEKSNFDLHVIIGKNGTGKTNILSAINWCLYGDEPNLSKDSRQLPLLNLKSMEEGDYGEDKEIMVEVWGKTLNNKFVIFTRKTIYNIYESGKNLPTRISSEFEVKVTDNKGNTEIFKDEESESQVERFVPKRIREFFFFDGERLDNYFKEATGQNIRHAIFEISQIDLLENRVESRLSDTLKDLRREAGKENPEIEDTRSQLETNEKQLKEFDEQIKECNKQIALAKDKIKDYDEKLRGIPDIEAVEVRRDEIKTLKQQKKELLDEKLKEKENLLFEYGKVVMLYSPIKQSIKIIEEKRKKGELPPTQDKSLLENMVKEKSCLICGRPFDADVKKRVEDLLKEIKLSSEVAKQLEYMEGPLHNFEDKVMNFNNIMQKITKEVKGYEDDLADYEQELIKIDAETSGYNSEKIKDWHKERKKFEDSFTQNLQKLGGIDGKRKDILKNIENLKGQLDDELKKEKKVKKLKNQIDFCTKALNVVKKTKEIIMSETRKKIEDRTKDIFFGLLWKKATFKDVKIEEDYSINLIHSLGYECLGSVSAGERELLALSFTLALHEVSGFDSPILIDTPVARISDEHRVNFGKIFSEVSSNKQTILLFTPAEYSKDIKELLDVRASNRFALKLSSDEKETRVEVL
ncbi:DNA replication and repair protein RecF [uncultured archaeon]|nr:DNA replication and repair protein RecF [uncultured archaeon]